MKSRFYIVGAILVASLIAAVLLIRKEKVTPLKPGDANAAARLSAFRAVWADANSKSLEFYAKILDQHGQPVVGAKVRGDVMTTESLAGPSWARHITQTDENGDFEFLGLHGQSLPIIAEKEGYEFKQLGNGGWTEDNKTSPEDRVVLQMWKLNGAEPLIHTKILDYISCDGTAESYNLQAGQRVGGGNTFTVKLTRNPVNIHRGKHFDWSVTFEMPSGGMIKTDDLYPYGVLLPATSNRLP